MGCANLDGCNSRAVLNGFWSELADQTLASEGPGEPSEVRVLNHEAILWCVSRLSRRRRRMPSHAATIVRGDGLSVAVGDGDGAAGDRNY